MAKKQKKMAFWPQLGACWEAWSLLGGDFTGTPWLSLCWGLPPTPKLRVRLLFSQNCHFLALGLPE